MILLLDLCDLVVVMEARVFGEQKRNSFSQRKTVQIWRDPAHGLNDIRGFFNSNNNGTEQLLGGPISVRLQDWSPETITSALACQGIQTERGFNKRVPTIHNTKTKRCP
jgi:hypothetical protein